MNSPHDQPMQSIITKLIRRTLAWALLFALAFGVLRAWHTYENVHKDFRLAVQNAANTHVQLLSLAIWDIEPRAIQRQIILLLDNPQIGYARVKASTGQTFEGGDATMLEHNDPLKFDIPQPGRTASIGTLEVVVNNDLLYREILRSVGVVLAQALALTAIILGLVVTILRRDLARPLRRLSEFVTSLQADNVAQPLKLQRPPGHVRDELDLMAEGFQTLQGRIHEHIASLDAEVSSRTDQLEKALSSLKTQSSLDALTGCYNRMLFNERFPGEMSRAQRYRRPLSIIFCDLDNFKHINDTHGHLVGDRILSAMGVCLRKDLRNEIDWVTRYGGEEFLVVLPETSMAAAQDIAERLRVDVMQWVTVRLADGSPLHVTASFGVAQQRDGETMESFVQRADDWLYVAKKGGRNQVQPPLETAAGAVLAPVRAVG